MFNKNTIAAISTPHGKGGVSMIRISGPEALSVSLKVFKSKNLNEELGPEPNMTIYGSFFDEQGPFDDGLLVFYRSPRSYTGEDVVELSCHGGLLVTQKLLKAVISSGASYAAAGEFTKRAFINGKLSLTAAEAVAGIIEAKNEKHLNISLLQMEGSLARKTRDIFNRLSYLSASVYAYIDYPDEDLTDIPIPDMREKLNGIYNELNVLHRSYKFGKAVSEGIETAIIGRPNTGKSSLLNLIAGYERAIVTDIMGTTRDIITEQVKLGDVLLNLADTAGIRQSSDDIEKLGIERAVSMIEKSELIYLLFDGNPSKEDEYIIDIIKKYSKQDKTVALYNKADIYDINFEKRFKYEIAFSSVTGAGLDTLIKYTAELYGAGDCRDAGTIITSARQYAAISSTMSAIKNAISALNTFTQDVAVSDIEEAMSSLGELDGRTVSEAVVSDIFNNFCVGK